MRLFALGTRVSFALVLLSGLAPAEAKSPALSIGAVNARVPAGEFAQVMKQALSEELAQAELPAKRSRGAFVLDATLVKLTAEKKNDGVRATAVVSVVLRRARDSSLHAMLSGKATAEESASVEATRDTALRAAVRSALRGLPQAVAAE
ncbi:MAG TPA: hypothetical protein VM686_00020 [Polyangiaceae bacterium]|nr:hypothetical protein [Polyangiaceae bacterium]